MVNWRISLLFWSSQSLSTLSIVLSSFVVFTLYLFPALRHEHNRIIVNLSTTNAVAAFFQLDFFNSSRKIFAKGAIDYCYVGAVGNQFFFMASFFWTACLAWNIFVTIVYRNHKLTERFFVLYHVLSWGVPLGSVLLLLHWDDFERNQDATMTWCWVKAGPGQLIFYVTLLVIIVFNMALISYTIYHVLRKYPTVNRAATSTWCCKVSSYVIVFIVVRVWSIINRLVVAITYRTAGGGGGGGAGSGSATPDDDG
eukprot:SAG22_NODE_2167_length_2905_cov_1.403778_4_plen_253_part_01